MQPHDPEHAALPPNPPDEGRRAEIPDDTSLSEQGRVSTQFDPDTGRRLKRGAAIAAGLLIVGFLSVVIIRYFDQRAVAKVGESAYLTPPPVDVVVAHAPPAGQDLVLPGQTAAWYETTIYARVNGYVGTWLVDIGDHVKKGQVLATIETPELDAELAAARAQLKTSEAQVEARKAEAEFSRTTNERWRDSPKGVVSEQERESKKADYDSSTATLYAAKAQVALDQSHVNQYSALTEFKLVRAPFDGTITERRIDIGNLVTAGSTTATTLLYRMSLTDPLRVFVDVPQSAAGELMKPGVPAQILATGLGGPIAGTITRSAQAINAQARTMKVEVDIPNTDHRLVPGMYVNVAFVLQPRGLVEVPAAALIFRAHGTQVARVDENSKVVFEDVTIGRDNGSMVELASGAKPGDRLVLNISSQIGPGEKVSADEAGAAPEKKQLAAQRQ
jgi:RND family efflux transporter MFP subunit